MLGSIVQIDMSLWIQGCVHSPSALGRPITLSGRWSNMICERPNKSAFINAPYGRKAFVYRYINTWPKCYICFTVKHAAVCMIGNG